MRIRILPDHVVDRIAAGEVVERPASVIKELVENSLDAEARSIAVIVQAGGRDRVEVVDDGTGMTAEEARLALRRHATSKIASELDLQQLDTFGFRGEALPSIASVSRLTLETRTADRPDGHRLVIEGGRVVTDEPFARTPGTTLRVEHLFVNVPARRKFLRTATTEYRYALEAALEAALARLDVGMRFEHDGREIFRVAAGQGLRERAAALFSRKQLEGALTLAVEAGPLRLRGVLGSPQTARKSASGVHLFVNGRPITHRGLSYALYSGYGELLPTGHYPFACLFLELDASSVDVNVHPAKREVRFRDEGLVRDFVLTSVRDTLNNQWGTASLRTADRGKHAEGPGSGRAAEWPAGLGPAAWEAATDLFRTAGDSEGVPTVSPEDIASTVPTVEGEEDAAGIEPVIWQVHDRYLIAPIRNGLLIVDQHAAHERVLYEEALARLTGKPTGRQQLLFPRVLDLTPVQYALVDELGPLLERVGFDVRPFGGHTVALEAVPPEIERVGREEEVFITLLDDLEQQGAHGSGVQEKIAASLACHAAIRFGDRLNPQQRRGLVDRLFACQRPQVCPHGRPTHLLLSLEELGRRFGR